MSRALLATLAMALFACGGSVTPRDGAASDGTDAPRFDASNVDTVDVPTDGPTCPGGRLACNGVCVDPLNDAANCGACGNPCASGSSCVGGICMVGCFAPRLTCGTPPVCVDTTSDAANCGRCGNLCAGGTICQGSVCTCAAGRGICSGSCVDLQSDTANCGSCGHACGAGQMCSMGACTILCAAPRAVCTVGGTQMCLDLQTDNLNCGACGNLCAGGTVCTGGLCGCAAGQTSCGGRCVDLQADPANCGACGSACTGGLPCTSGACGCNAPFMTCGAACVNVVSDNVNCGHCGNICAGGTSCHSGLCGCAAGQAYCGGACIDVQSDANNCGSCGHACTGGQTCSAGVCGCSGGHMMCGAVCVNTQSDSANCGACGNNCGGGTVCSAGLCSCAPGLMFCGGACRDVQRDSNNCGSCGFVCPAGQACGSGTCRAAVDVTILIDVTGSNFSGVSNAASVLPSRLVAPLLALPGVQVGVSYTGEFPVSPYGSTGDHPFRGVTEPTATASTINSAITTASAAGGGDTDDAMIEGLAPLAGLAVHPNSVALTCSAGRVTGGCWRSGARRIIVLVTDDEFHNGPDPNPAVTTLVVPYTGITPAPAIWPDVLTAMRSSSETLLFMNSNSTGAASPGAPQYTRMLGDLSQPATDAFLATDAATMGTAADAVVARIRALTGL